MLGVLADQLLVGSDVNAVNLVARNEARQIALDELKLANSLLSLVAVIFLSPFFCLSHAYRSSALPHSEQTRKWGQKNPILEILEIVLL